MANYVQGLNREEGIVPMQALTSFLVSRAGTFEWIRAHWQKPARNFWRWFMANSAANQIMGYTYCTSA